MLKTKVQIDGQFGRSLIVVEDVKQGTTVLEEYPLTFGPKPSTRIVCLGCYRILESDQRCSNCSWPLCGDCVDNQMHANNECKVFAKAKVYFNGNMNDNEVCLQLDCITPLRVLLAKETQAERWREEIEHMEYHDHARRQITEIWHADRVNIAEYLRGPCKLAERFDEDLIMRVIGILEVNAFEARTPQGNLLRCLFPNTAILAHNCVPNTIRTIYPSEGYKVRLRAMVDISAGQQLQHSYTYTLNGTTQRLQHILAGKFFTCDCRRCEDPTELGTNFSTFKCAKCDNGWIWSTNPLDISDSCVWQCSCCDFKTKHGATQKAIAVMEAEVAEVLASESGEDRLTRAEYLMRKYRSVLHPLHFIQTNLRQNLIEMYGRVAGYEMIALPDILLERKVELCRQVLRVLDVFEPGLSRSRALMLYELHVPLMLLAKNAFISKSITSVELQQRLLEVIGLLRESTEILQHEDHVSQEGILGKVAQQAMEELTTSVEGLNAT